MEESRKQFEEWAKSKWDNDLGYVLSDGNYAFEPVQLQWEGWQASRAAIEVNLPDIEIGYEMQEYFEPEDVKNSIRAAGLKIKGE